MGCDRSGADRSAVSGSVTLAGQPVDGGSIDFAPSGVNQVSATGAMIFVGRYFVPCKNGLVPGKYCVRIYWPEKVDAEQVPKGPPGPPAKGSHIGLPKERIPAKYNIESELTVEVRQGGANTFDFPLSANQ